MIFAFLPSVSCQVQTTTLLLNIFLAIDLVFILYVAHTTSLKIKNGLSFILLVQGTIFSLVDIFNFEKITLIICTVVLLVLYYQSTYSRILTKIILVLNSSFLSHTVKSSIIRGGVYDPTFYLRILTILLLIYVCLSIVSEGILLKIHTVLVGFVICAYLISLNTNTKLITPNTNTMKRVELAESGGILQICLNLFTLLTLTYIEFAL